MVSVLFNWIYIAVTTFCLGVGCSAVIEKVFDYRIKRIDSLLIAGIIVATVYAQYFSLVSGVGLIANIVLVLVCIIVIFLCHKSIREYLIKAKKSYSLPKIIVLFVFVLLWAYFTSRGPIHIDTDLYHAQSIRWIEEYGVVPGLGNIHERFAYNSSFFALSALYSMKFLVGQSLHTVSGFFALLLSITVLDITKSWKKHRFELVDYASLGAIYYLFTITDEVISPASDYSIMCMIFFVTIKWLDLLAQKEKDIAPYALLCVVGVYALTLKLTAGLVLILLIKPAYMLIREKRVKQIVIYLCMGLLVAIPWFTRTVVISGWLLYPFPALDLFNFDWEMNAELIAVDAAQISVWGKALYDISLVDTPITKWLPNWFSTTLSGTEKFLILGNMFGTILYVVALIWIAVKRKTEHLDMILVFGMIVCSYLFWQLSAPLMRYGYAYVLLLDFLLIGYILTNMNLQKVEVVVYFVILLYGGYKLLRTGEYIYNCRLVDSYIWQSEYGKYEMETYEIDGITFYKPVYGALSGYDMFPATPTKEEVELRGKKIEDGFRRK